MEAIWTISFKIRAKIEVIKHMFCVLLIISRQFVTALLSKGSCLIQFTQLQVQVLNIIIFFKIRIVSPHLA